MMIASMFMMSASAQQLTKADKTAAIQTIAKLIASNYVYPEKGGQIASHIQSANFQGAFEKATNWKEFDDLVTHELQAYSKDVHLYIRHNPDVTKSLKAAPKNEDRSKVLTYDDEMSGSSGITDSKVLDSNVGYLKISEINFNRKNLQEVYDAMKKIEGTKSLIIDLRDNGGGGSEVGPVLESYFIPSGKPILQFTKRDGNTVTDSTIMRLEGKSYDRPVYILVNRNTASAAEAFAFVLQQHKKARVVGERSAGAAYKNEWFAIDDENFVSVSTAAPSIPGKNISWELEGIQPDIKVRKGDALEVALKEASRA